MKAKGGKDHRIEVTNFNDKCRVYVEGPKVLAWDEDPNSPRYGLPVTFLGQDGKEYSYQYLPVFENRLPPPVTAKSLWQAIIDWIKESW